MKISETHHQVIIIGAGPTGLMMAAQLLRYGIQPLIIDSRQGPTSHSKALAVQARSLEIYRQLGIVDKVLADGKTGKGIAFHTDGELRAELHLDSVGPVDTPFPYILMYPQSSNERALLEYLTLHCCPVYWNTTLTALSQTADAVSVSLQTDGGLLTITCDWLVGADGAHSPVRKGLNIAFEGDTYASLFYLIDSKIPDLDDDQIIKIYLSDSGLAGFFPMPEKGYFRVIGNLPARVEDADEIHLSEILPGLQKITQKNIEVTDCRWLITYKLHHRMAGSFKVGRCFLAGDAGHIHSPVGGQGMNTGLQDAYNLAWKLALMLIGKAGAAILNSYAAERMPVARRLLNLTDRAFTLAMSDNWLSGFFKKHLMARLLNLLWRFEKIRHLFFVTVSQTGISYRESSLSLHLSQSKNVKAGDRLPCLTIYDEKKKGETDLHEWCSKPGFTLLILGNVIEKELFDIAKWLTQTYPGIVNFCYLPWSEKNQKVFEVFETGKRQHKSIVVRPDMHIGYLNDAIDLKRMADYFDRIGVISEIKTHL